MNNLDDTRARVGRPLGAKPPKAERSRGQILILFVMAIFVFTGMVALVIDVSWYWVNSLRVQRAADAAALAGVIALPGDPTTAYALARAEATKNGYTGSVGLVPITITPVQDPPINGRRLNVTVSAPVNMFFMRIFGINDVMATRTAKAEFVLPVPMGSPQNYFGVGFFRDGEVTTSLVANAPTNFDTDTGARPPTETAPSGGQWLFTPTGPGKTITSAVTANDNEYATETTDLQIQQWGQFGVVVPPAGANETVTIRGIEVRLTDAFLNASCSNSVVRASLSWDTGGNWSSWVATTNLGQTASTDYTLPATGGSTSFAAWGAHPWVRAEFADNLFRARLQFDRGCTTAGRNVNVDALSVRVYYRIQTTTYTTVTTTDVVDRDVISPYGDVLVPQKFWGAMQSQGAPNLQGDAYMTKYDTRSGSVLNGNDGTDPDAEYNYNDYYGYAVEMPANSSGGEVWIFDPGFCDASSSSGTGESWTVNGTNSGGIQPTPVSAFYTLKDAGVNLFDPSDDGTVYSTTSGDTFKRQAWTDRSIITELQTTGQPLNGDPGYDNDRTVGGDCADLSWHYDVNSWDNAPTTPRRGWYLLGSGLTGGPGGTTYRLHTYSTDTGSPNDQNNATGLNAFAIYATASGSDVPRVYGIGAMEAYVRLPGGESSEFYLAQIEAAHAGKTMVINLWDPGDTGSLSADLEILAPGTTNYTPVQFSYNATLGTTDSTASNGGTKPDCRTQTSGAGTTNSVTTSNGGTGTNGSRFNGCWLTIRIQIPDTYDAPHPSSDSVTADKGWWKIRYNMGSGSTFSTDLTTWQVDILGNPVHLIVP